MIYSHVYPLDDVVQNNERILRSDDPELLNENESSVNSMINNFINNFSQQFSTRDNK
jgi:hypothetical protein